MLLIFHIYMFSLLPKLQNHLVFAFFLFYLCLFPPKYFYLVDLNELFDAFIELQKTFHINFQYWFQLIFLLLYIQNLIKYLLQFLFYLRMNETVHPFSLFLNIYGFGKFSFTIRSMYPIFF